MGKLIRNGIEYGGGNGTDIFEVTQSEYNALKQAGTLVHNALYVISDAPNLNATASDIEYSSGVTVKQAIDSKADTNNFAKKSVSLTEYVSISGNTIDTQSFSVNNATYGIICGFAVTNTPEVVVMQCYFDGTSTIYLRVRNVSTSTQSYKATIYYI